MIRGEKIERGSVCHVMIEKEMSSRDKRERERDSAHGERGMVFICFFFKTKTKF